MDQPAVECPSCRVVLPTNATHCPDCREDLSALIQLRRRSSILYNEGLRLALSGDGAAAVERLQLALREDPSDVDMLLLLGKLHARGGRDDEARSAWETALRHAPDDPRVMQALQALASRTAEAERRSRQAEDERRARDEAAAQATRRRQRQGQLASYAAGIATLGVAVAAWYALGRQAPATASAATAAPASVAVVAAPPASAAQPVTPADDAPLAARVEEALQRQPALRGVPLQVKADHGTVIVEGRTRDLLQRWLVESAVRSVPGVQLVELKQLALDDAYVVKAGDTLSSIAARRYGSAAQWQALALSNGIEAPYLLSTGQRLAVP